MQVKFEGFITLPDPVVASDVREPCGQATAFCNEEPIADLGTYAGKMVFVEADYKDDKGNLSTYRNGEYFVYRSSPATLYVMSVSGREWDGQYGTHVLALVGAQKFKILDIYEQDDLVKDYIQYQRQWATKALKSDNKQYVDSVYHNALKLATYAERALNSKYSNKR
jgi:hypothetical protein